jgi:hypothetical protein
MLPRLVHAACNHVLLAAPPMLLLVSAAWTGSRALLRIFVLQRAWLSVGGAS